jgi:hypothetical protein
MLGEVAEVALIPMTLFYPGIFEWRHKSGEISETKPNASRDLR